jgi:hypothetical protein
VPLAAPARRHPRRQRQEQGDELEQRVRQQGDDEHQLGDPQSAGERGGALAEHERLRDQREARGQDDEEDRERPGAVVHDAPPAAVVLGLQRQRAAGDEARDAGHPVQRKDE